MRKEEYIRICAVSPREFWIGTAETRDSLELRYIYCKLSELALSLRLLLLIDLEYLKENLVIYICLIWCHI